MRALLLVLLLVACSGRVRRAADGPARLSPGNHEITLSHGGRDRWILVHVPAAATRGTPLPLVIAFHGGGGEPTGFRSYAGLDAIADREGFVVAYPAGTGPLPRRLLTWNAGDGCCGYALNNRIDDVGFTVALIEDLSRRASIDPRRVYATGHSNGAIMSYRLAAERPERFAAIVAVAGALDVTLPATARPVSVLHIHSVDDPRALYAGGLGPPFPGTNNRVQHQPVEAGLARFRSVNGCTGEPRTAEQRRGTAGSANAGQSATHLVWQCNSARVEHWRLTGVGHGWPGRAAGGLAGELTGPPTTLVDAAEAVWTFMRGAR